MPTFWCLKIIAMPGSLSAVRLSVILDVGESELGFWILAALVSAAFIGLLTMIARINGLTFILAILISVFLSAFSLGTLPLTPMTSPQEYPGSTNRRSS